MFRRGKELRTRTKFNKDSEERSTPFEEQEDEPREKNLLRKTKELRKARLSYNEAEIGEKEAALKDYLASEYERLQRSNSEDARRSMMILIRTDLIQNPYDHIGRSMASDAKQIFLRQVLNETNLGHKLQGLLKIPGCLKRNGTTRQILIAIPVMLAVWGTAQKGFFYVYDIYTDAEVIKELHTMKEMTVPKIPDLQMKDFLLIDVKEKALPALRTPCELLDVLETIPTNMIPFYKDIVKGFANVHWNPTRNSTFNLSDAFDITERLSKIYTKAIETVGVSDIPSKPSDINKFLAKSKRLLTDAKAGLEDANTGVTKFFAGWLTD